MRATSGRFAGAGPPSAMAAATTAASAAAMAMAVGRRISGSSLVAQHEDAVADDRRVLQAQGASLGRRLEGLLTDSEDHGEDHQVDLVDEVARNQLLHEPVAAR